MEIGSLSWKHFIQSGAEEFGITVPDKALESFAVHVRELNRWNRIINLTTITDPLQMAIKHYLDAILPATVIPRHSNLLDIGSGAGFPGIPLKIIEPSLTVTLIDSVRKKVNFLKHVIRTLELENIVAFQSRAEDFARNTIAAAKDRGFSVQRRETSPTDQSVELNKGPFNVVISRALTSLNSYIKIALPLLAENGMLIAMKGRLTESELHQARVMLPRYLQTAGLSADGCDLEVVRYKLPSLDAERTLVTLRTKG